VSQGVGGSRRLIPIKEEARLDRGGREEGGTTRGEDTLESIKGGLRGGVGRTRSKITMWCHRAEGGEGRGVRSGSGQWWGGFE